MKRPINVWLVLVLWGVGVCSAGASALDAAGGEFAAGDYEAAARDYESALAVDGPSAGLYYNLGLAQMKAGRNLPALANVRRALLLNPAMAEARGTLAELESSLGISPRRPDWRDWVAVHIPLKVALVASTGVAWLGLFLILRALFFRRKRWAPICFAILLVLLGLAGSGVSFLSDPRFSARNLGVVISEDAAPMRSAPADQSETLAQIAPGDVIRVLSRRGIWSYCESSDGLKGWLSTSQIESLIPATGV